MAWDDRITEGAYVSPSGVRHIFTYEDVSKITEKNTVAFTFPDADGTYVQDLGHAGRRYPLRVIFWGDDYDIEADSFEESIRERGVGILEHPIYGVIDVVPFGAITRRDNLKTAANQAIIDVVFWETIGLVYPTAQNDPASQVVSAVDEFNEAAADQFESATSLSTAVEQATLKGRFQKLLDSVDVVMGPITEAQAEIQKQFDAINDSINASIDTLIADPLTLAFQTAIMIQAPARANELIEARLDAYKNLLDSLTTGNNAIAVPGFDSSNSNIFHSRDLFSSAYVSGSVLSVVNNQFETKTDALAAADSVLSQMDQLTAWRDDNFESLSEIDAGGSYQQLLEAVGLAAGFLVEISFTLKQEKRIILDRARNIVELVAELYGSIDDQLDFFIDSNDLTGSEILELPAGREVVYYV